MGLLSQSLVIFRKNVTVKKHPKKVFNTLMEICMPVFYAAFIYCFVGVLVDQDVPEVHYLNASNPAPLDCRCGSECRGSETIAFAPNASSRSVEFSHNATVIACAPAAPTVLPQRSSLVSVEFSRSAAAID